MLWDFDRKMASPTESAVRLDQAVREHSGAGILNPMGDCRGCGYSQSPDLSGGGSRDTRMTPLDVKSGELVFCGNRFSMRVVPRSMISCIKHCSAVFSRV